MNVRVRIAPSPTGYPHIGTIWQALVNFAYARKYQGKFIVRIEDTDRKRFVVDAEKKIFKALDWLDLIPDESPIHGGKYGPYRQSQRLEIYKKYAQILIDKKAAYYCFCTQERINKVRKEMSKNGKPPMYDKHCCDINPEEAKRKVNAGEKYVVRLRVPKNKTIVVQDLLRGKVEFDSNTIDDQVLIKSDGFPTYHLAVVVDDYLMKISHMVRGEQWLPSAPKQILLYDFFGWKKPVFVHTPTLRNPDKSKLSKRQGHTDVSWYKQQGYLPEALLNFLCLLGWAHPKEKTIFSLEEFIKYFEFKDLSPVGPIVDLKKLDYINGVYIRETSDDKLIQLIKPFSQFQIPNSKFQKMIPLIKQRINKLADIDEMISFFVKIPQYEKSLFKGDKAKEELDEIYQVLIDIKVWQQQEIYKIIKKIFGQGKFDKKEFFVNLYVAIEGKTAGLPVFESMEILGKEESLKRFKVAINYLSK